MQARTHECEALLQTASRNRESASQELSHGLSEMRNTQVGVAQNFP